jgi:hypothetical protein
MIFDGIHQMQTGSYFGGAPGPWAAIVRAMGVDPQRMGPVFVCLGILWLAGCVGLLAKSRWVYLVAAVITLLYPLFGTLLSIIALIIYFTSAVELRTKSSK